MLVGDGDALGDGLGDGVIVGVAAGVLAAEVGVSVGLGVQAPSRSSAASAAGASRVDAHLSVSVRMGVSRWVGEVTVTWMVTGKPGMTWRAVLVMVTVVSRAARWAVTWRLSMDPLSAARVAVA